MLDILVHNPELRRQASAREHERIRHRYMWPEITQSIEEVYCQVLGWPTDKRLELESSANVGSLRAQGLD